MYSSELSVGSNGCVSERAERDGAAVAALTKRVHQRLACLQGLVRRHLRSRCCRCREASRWLWPSVACDVLGRQCLDDQLGLLGGGGEEHLVRQPHPLRDRVALDLHLLLGVGRVDPVEAPDEAVLDRHVEAALAHLVAVADVRPAVAALRAAVELFLPLGVEGQPLHLAAQGRQRDALLGCPHDALRRNNPGLQELGHCARINLPEMTGAGAVGGGGEHPRGGGERRAEDLRQL